jgi:hypothetical protein
MTSPRELTTARRVQGQGRILELLAEDDAPLTGTLQRLSRQFQLDPDDLRNCLLELAYAGWITIHVQPFGRVTIQLEQGDGAKPVTVAGCRSVPQAWRL